MGGAGPLKIGFIGLGAMGAPMAASLLGAGHALRVHDARREAAAELVGRGAQWAGSAGAAAAGAEVLFTCLPGPQEVENVALGEGGLWSALQPGAVWFDLTTNSPSIVRRLAEKFAQRGITVLDAPVSGGPEGARTRRLALWVGGDETAFTKHLPLLQAMGDEVLRIGAIGSGTVAKLVHNGANFAVQVALAEAFTLGVKAGVDPLTLFKALRQGTTGRKRTFDRLAEQFLPGAYDPPAFALKLAKKDMQLVLALAASCGVPMRIGEIAMQEIAAAVERGWGERDARIALALQEERAGVSVRVPRAELQSALAKSG